MSDLSDPYDRRGLRRESVQQDCAGVPYAKRTCIRCGVEITAPPSRIRHVFWMHAKRCDASSPTERAAFRQSGRWPKRKAAS